MKDTRIRVGCLFVPIAAINVAAWLALISGAHRFALLLPLGVAAYVLGLRHAVDADHIAAIDATTRKLMHQGKRAEGVGLYFSLGHSTIVIALSALVAVFGASINAHFPVAQKIGATVGTWISVGFLLVVAAANVLVLMDMLRRKGRDGDETLAGGVLSRLLQPALGVVTRDRQMYLAGLLFGLGFDTATEVALLGISAASGAGGMPVAYILVLPCLFTAGMSLLDTAQGLAMVRAYGWAYLRPKTKTLYNVNMTLLTIAIALSVGAFEAIPAIANHTQLSFTCVGIAIMAVFAVNFALTALLYRYAFRAAPE